jgi:hypothetical protein
MKAKLVPGFIVLLAISALAIGYLSLQKSSGRQTNFLRLGYADPKLRNLRGYWGRSAEDLIKDFGVPHIVDQEGAGVESWIFRNQKATSNLGPQAIIFHIENGIVTFGMYEAEP